MARTEIGGGGSTIKKPTVVTSTAALQAAQRAAEAAQKAAAAKSASAQLGKPSLPTSPKTVGTIPPRITPTVVNSSSMAPSPAQLAAIAQAKLYEQVKADAAAREEAIKRSPTMAPAPPSSNSVGPYSPVIPSSGAPVKTTAEQVKDLVNASGEMAKVFRYEQFQVNPNTGFVPPITRWTEQAIQDDRGSWEKDKLLKDENGKPYWKNYADWALDKYGSSAPGLDVASWGPAGPTVPALPNGYVYTPTPWPTQAPLTDETETEGGELNLVQPELPEITWEAKYTVDNAPAWWQGFVPSRNDPQSEYATMLNAMIPFMSPEDQRYTASMLYRLYPKTFAGYNPETVGMPAIPTDMTTDMTRYMTSAARANEVLNTLNKVKNVSASGTKFGPGYEYLRQLGSLLRDFGGAEGAGQTRSQYSQFASAYDPLAAETKQENLAAFSELTRMLAQPYYSAGRVTPTTTLSNGAVIPGEVNKSYF